MLGYSITRDGRVYKGKSRKLEDFIGRVTKEGKRYFIYTGERRYFTTRTQAVIALIDEHNKRIG